MGSDLLPARSDGELLDAAEAAEALGMEWALPLSRLDADALSPAQRVQWAVATHRLCAVVEELSLRALNAVPSRPCAPVTAVSEPESPDLAQATTRCPGGWCCEHHWEIEELAALTRASRGTMIRRRTWAHELATYLVPLRPLLAGGQIGVGHLITASTALVEVPAEIAGQVVADTIGRVACQAPQQFACTLARAVKRALSPEQAAARRQKAAKRSTGASFYAKDDGLATMSVTAPVEQIEAIRAVLASHPAITDPGPGDQRSRGQRQVDLLVDLCLASMTELHGAGVSRANGLMPTAGAPTAGAPTAAAKSSGCRPPSGVVPIGVVITASLETLEGSSNEPGLVGDRVTDAVTVRQLSDRRSWARVAVYDHRGIIVSLGRKQRFPSPGLRIAVGVRNPRCVFPGCSRRAEGCEIDHSTAWEHGGRTDLSNLYPLCRLHHHLKHQPDWQVAIDPRGSLTWTLPGGQRITVKPTDHRRPPGPHDRTPDQAANSDLAIRLAAALAAQRNHGFVNAPPAAAEWSSPDPSGPPQPARAPFEDRAPPVDPEDIRDPEYVQWVEFLTDPANDPADPGYPTRLIDGYRRHALGQPARS